MSGIKKKPVTVDPLRIIRIEVQEFRKKNMNKISTTHGSAGVTRFGFFNHRHRQDADIISCQFVYINAHRIILNIKTAVKIYFIVE